MRIASNDRRLRGREEDFRDAFGNGGLVEPILGVEIGKAAGLPELLDAQGSDTVTRDSAQP